MRSALTGPERRSRLVSGDAVRRVPGTLTRTSWPAAAVAQPALRPRESLFHNPSPQPPPRNGEGESVSSLPRVQAGRHHRYEHFGVQTGALSPLRFGEGSGEGSAAPLARSGR